ncbi:hypothetical protein SAMN06296378_1406 [Salinibacterium xinjiangense]|uniref:Uncharacterized protein n=1 Tax=Salinibacterium xinjiangense TaxID=386302 RepID=A0A2C8ZIC6_9MICO|nr:hypothetical protein SAMN06296378_1406 [Salinibacterium xinjiangense]
MNNFEERDRTRACVEFVNTVAEVVLVLDGILVRSKGRPRCARRRVHSPSDMRDSCAVSITET